MLFLSLSLRDLTSFFIFFCNLQVRHVAIGWLVVDNIFQDEKKAKKGQMPKRVRRVMSRSKRSHIPGEADLDGVAIGLVRLHDYYKYDLTR